MPKPTNTDKFAAALRDIAAQQIREIAHRLTAKDILAGKNIDLSAWPAQMVHVLRPFLIKEQQVGMREAMLEHHQALAARKLDVKAIRGKMLREIDAAITAFVTESLTKIEDETAVALKPIRRRLKQGKITDNQAKQLLVEHLKGTLGAPNRAVAAANYHGHAARQQGKQRLAKETGTIKSKTWVYVFGPNVCRVCADLHGKTVGIDEPFITLPGGGTYAVVMLPPLHVHCQCRAVFGSKPVKSRKKSWEEVTIEERVKRG